MDDCRARLVEFGRDNYAGVIPRGLLAGLALVLFFGVEFEPDDRGLAAMIAFHSGRDGAHVLNGSFGVVVGAETAQVM